MKYYIIYRFPHQSTWYVMRNPQGAVFATDEGDRHKMVDHVQKFQDDGVIGEYKLVKEVE